MSPTSLLDQVKAIEMARTYYLQVNTNPDEIVAGYFVDATGQMRRVSKARWRWYQDIAEVPARKPPEPDDLSITVQT